MFVYELYFFLTNPATTEIYSYRTTTSRHDDRPISLTFNDPLGGGLPMGVIPEAYCAVWNLLLFDGALAHLSRSVYERVRKRLGFVISWGAPGHFERRQIGRAHV